MKCSHGGCQTDATHTITAAYPIEALDAHLNPHPPFATYPMPMARACRTHLAVIMEMDSEKSGATPAYLVKVVS